MSQSKKSQQLRHIFANLDLTFALYEEALGPDDVDSGEISIDQLKDALSKHEGLFWVTEFPIRLGPMCVLSPACLFVIYARQYI